MERAIGALARGKLHRAVGQGSVEGVYPVNERVAKPFAGFGVEIESHEDWTLG
jgi:hypothetical protein